MSEEKNANMETTSALARKTGKKSIFKIICAVFAVIFLGGFALNIFGDSSAVYAVKNSVFSGYDKLITLEEAVDRFCAKKNKYDSTGSNYFEDSMEFLKRADKTLDGALVKSAFKRSWRAEWHDLGETSTGISVVELKILADYTTWADSTRIKMDKVTKIESAGKYVKVEMPSVEEYSLKIYLHEDGTCEADGVSLFY